MSAHDEFCVDGLNLHGDRAVGGSWISNGTTHEYFMGSTPPPDAARLDSRDLDELAGRHYADGWRAGQADLQEQIRTEVARAHYTGKTEGIHQGYTEERNWWQSNVAHDVRQVRTRVEDLAGRRTKAIGTLISLAESLCLKVASRHD